MKKLIAVIMILIMLVPAAVCADSTDPIVGTWYIFFDMEKTPEMSQTFQGYDRLYMLYTMTKDGVVYCLENDVANNSGTPMFNAAGKWEKNGNRYTVSLIGFGQGDAYISGDDLQCVIYNNDGIYFRLHKMIYFDPYKDLTR